MYLRFIVSAIHDTSHKYLGIFQAAAELRDGGTLSSHDYHRLQSVIDWFNVHLEKPTRFTASKPPFSRKAQRAISWFKPTAQKHLAHIHEMVSILEDHGIQVTMLKADRIGYVVYEDEYQIVAEPFADTRA